MFAEFGGNRTEAWVLVAVYYTHLRAHETVRSSYAVYCLQIQEIFLQIQHPLFDNAVHAPVAMRNL
ncbi:hypothetical protein, partial [Clostridioides sp. ZZV14-5902]|uniref:hypothetical protein n=1 Tax=Clostridioides sp. ZZV14-5902 TaxID=2811486 RepID=UPI0039BCBC11